MNYKLVKKLVKVGEGKNEKKFINFYLVNSEDRLIIPIEIKAFKNKEGKISNQSKFSWNLANQTAEWMYGSENNKDL